MLFNILSALQHFASSKTAEAAQHKRFLSVLEALRSALQAVANNAPDATNSAGRFSNAASDFFCCVRVMAPSPREPLEKLSAQIEDALREQEHGGMKSDRALRLLAAVDAIATTV